MSADARETARKIVADMTEDEKLWCLDGDAPIWAGLGYMGRGGYHKSPFYAARGRAARTAGLRLQRRPARCGGRSGDLLSGQHGARRDVGRRPRRAHRRCDRRSSSEPSAPTSTAAVCVNMLRHPAWGRAQETYGEDPHHVGEMGAALDARHPAARDGVREALRMQLDGERTIPRRHRGRRSRAARGLSAPLQAHRRRRRRGGDERIQQRQRRVVRRQRAAAHRRPARRVGLRGVRDQRLDLRDPRRCEVCGRRPRRRDALPDGAGHGHCATP